MAGTDLAPEARLSAGVANDLVPDPVGVEDPDLSPDAAAAARLRALPGKGGVVRAASRETERRTPREDRSDGPDDDLMKVIDNMR